MKDLVKPLQITFGDLWEEIYALVLVLIMGHVPLKRACLVWEKLYPIIDIQPSMTLNNLSQLLKDVG